MFVKRFATPQAASRLGVRSLQTSPRSFARKDGQDKDSIQVTSHEYSQTGSDQESAHVSAAFDPNQTRPEGQQKSADADPSAKAVSPAVPFENFDQSILDEERLLTMTIKGGNPLDASPANHEFSKPGSTKDRRVEGSPSEAGSGGKDKSSGHGSAPKHGSGQHGGGSMGN